MSGSVQLVMGLGNPGRRYAGTRHNLGAEAVDELAARADRRWRRGWRVPARWARGTIEGKNVLLIKPQTYMNRSGEALASLLRYYRGAVDTVTVLYDDLDLPLGALRIRRKGSAGSHNGLASVLAAAGGRDVTRVRLGIGACPAGRDRADFVLSAFDAGEREAARKTVRRAAEAVCLMLRDGVEQAMNTVNGKPDAPAGGTQD